MPREALALFDMTKEYTIVALRLCTFQAEQSLSTRVFSWLIVLGILPKNGGCAAAEHLSGGDSPLGMLGLSRRRKGRDTGGRNCSIAGTVLCFFYWNSNSMLLASNNRMALSDCRWILIFLIRVSHITPFFELSLVLLTTHAIGLYEVTKKISALQTVNCL